MIILILFLTIFIVMWLFYQIIVVKKETNQKLKKIHDNTIFNIIMVMLWCIFVFLILPFSPQSLFYGDMMLLINIIGLILIILGGLNLIWLFMQKRGIGGQEMDKLLTTGAYGLCRHPIYLSHMLIFYGLIFVVGAFDALILSPIIIILYIITARTEEVYSIGKIFKEEYENYRNSVPMLLKWWLFLTFCTVFILFFLLSLNFGFLEILIRI